MYLGAHVCNSKNKTKIKKTETQETAQLCTSNRLDKCIAAFSHNGLSRRQEHKPQLQECDGNEPHLSWSKKAGQENDIHEYIFYMNFFLMLLFLEPLRGSLSPAFVHPSVSMGTCIQSSPNHQPSGSHKETESLRKWKESSLPTLACTMFLFESQVLQSLSPKKLQCWLLTCSSKRVSNQPDMTGGGREEGGCADPRGWHRASEPTLWLPTRNNHPDPQMKYSNLILIFIQVKTTKQSLLELLEFA